MQSYRYIRMIKTTANVPTRDLRYSNSNPHGKCDSLPLAEVTRAYQKQFSGRVPYLHELRKMASTHASLDHGGTLDLVEILHNTADASHTVQIRGEEAIPTLLTAWTLSLLIET